MNKRENIYSLDGFSKVFKFTMRQTFKNKGYLVSFIIFVLCMTLMGPIQYLGQHAGQSAAEDSTGFSPADVSISDVTIINNTTVELKVDDLPELYERDEDADQEAGLLRDNITISNIYDSNISPTGEEILNNLGEEDVVILINMDETGYKIDGVISEDSTIGVSDLDKMTTIVQDRFDEKRLEDNELSDEDVQMISSGINTGGVYSEDDYISEGTKTVAGQNYMFYMLGFSMIVFIVVSMSNSYIITSVTEEKQSKLVESLLVSVRPMALLLGKVCGMMSYVVLVLVCGVIGSNLSSLVMKNVFNISESEFSSGAFNFSIFKDFGVVGAICLTLSIILAFLAFGMVGGLFGSMCNKTEDMQTATGNVMTISMLGYFAAIFGAMIDNDIVNKVAAIIPPFSFFTTPVAFVSGRIGVPLLILSYVLQIAVIVGVIMLAARTYRNLLLSDSTTPKLKTIFKSMKG